MFKDVKLLQTLFYLLLLSACTFLMALVGTQYGIAIIILAAILAVLTAVVLHFMISKNKSYY
jgi:hypothetical protein